MAAALEPRIKQDVVDPEVASTGWVAHGAKVTHHHIAIADSAGCVDVLIAPAPHEGGSYREERGRHEAGLVRAHLELDHFAPVVAIKRGERDRHCDGFGIMSPLPGASTPIKGTGACD